MPIEHINKTDTLNEGREKLNAAIDGANAADVTSKEADTKATQALANSESTQTQLDTIVIDGDSSVEAAQARVDENGVPHPTLKARIDDGMNSVNQQLAQTTEKIERKEFDIWDFIEFVPMHNILNRSDWDWTKAIQEALKTIPHNSILNFPSGVYNHGDGVINKKPSSYSEAGTHNGYTRYEGVDGVSYPYYTNNGTHYPIGDTDIGEDRRLLIDDLKNVLIKGYGAVIKAHGDNACIRMNGGFIFTNCENVKIEGLMYNGNISERKPFLVDTAWFNRQNGFEVGTNCKNIVFENVSANECVMDGFYIHSGTLEEVTLQNCNGYRNYRQGATFGSTKQCNIIGGVFAETGTIYGTAPMAGIDLEMQSGLIDGAIIDGVTLKDNIGTGVSLHWNTINSVVKNCTFVNNSLYEDRNGTINNDIIDNTFHNGIINAHGGGTRIIGNKLYFIADENSNSYLAAIGSDDSSNKFKTGISRKGEIKNNYIEVTLGNDIDHITVYGVIGNIGSEINEVEGNTVINAFNATGTGTQVVNGRALTLKNNKFIYNGNLENAGIIRGANEVGYNEISPAYIDNNVENRNYKIKEMNVNGYEFSKTFFIEDRIPTNKQFDIIFDGVADVRLIDITLNTGGNAYGLWHKIIAGASTNVDVIQNGNIHERWDILPPTIKNGKTVVTITPISPDPSNHNSRGFEGLIKVSIDTTRSKTEIKDITLSDPYDV